MKKKLIAALTGLCVLASSTAGVFATNLEINGALKTPTNAKGQALSVFNENGSVYVPIRFISESLGCVVGWDASSETVKVSEPTIGFVMSTTGSFADVVINKSWVTLDNTILKADKYDVVKLTEQIGKFSKENDWGVVFRTDNGSVIIEKTFINSNIDYKSSPVNVYLYGGQAVGIGGWDE